MRRLTRNPKVIDGIIYLNDGTVIPGLTGVAIHDNTRHSETYITEPDLDYEIENYSSDKILAAGDFRKIHLMDVSGGDRQFTLPDIGATHIGQWIILGRVGTGFRLTIQAGGTDILLNSTPGGTIDCDDSLHNYSLIELVVLANGVWGNPSFGIWKTR